MRALFGDSPLILRIYLVGIAQTIIVMLGFVLLHHFDRPTPALEQRAEEMALVANVSDALSRRETVRDILAASEKDGLESKVTAPDGTTLASTFPKGVDGCAPSRRQQPPSRPNALRTVGEPPPPNPPPPPPRNQRPPPPDDDRPPPRGQECKAVPLPFPGGETGHIAFRRPHPTPLSPFSPIVLLFMLVVLAVASRLSARAFARPLRKLNTAARAFGEGDLTARAGLDRSDELGEVGRAFDDMADRMTELLWAEREMVANVAHEIRTPLARIRVALDIVAEGGLDALDGGLDAVADDLGELEELVANVVAAARLEFVTNRPRGIPPLKTERVAVQSLVDNVADRFRLLYPDRPLVVDVPAALLVVEGDPSLLRRVFNNLLDNAHKYTPTSTAPVCLAVTAETHVQIDIRDFGVGLSPTDQKAVFHPFFRADRSRTRATGGLGLGLTLAKRIVDAHHGALTLESQAGEGTLARVRLPLASF